MQNNIMSTFDKLRRCRLFLLDMDGTLYLGDNVYEGAVDLSTKFPDAAQTTFISPIIPPARELIM